MEPVAKRHRTNRRRSAAPVLLPTFFVATAAIVLAVVALDRIHSYLGDAGVLALAVLLAALLLVAIARLLGEQEPPPGDDRPDRSAGGSP